MKLEHYYRQGGQVSPRLASNVRNVWATSGWTLSQESVESIYKWGWPGHSHNNTVDAGC